jgi:uncharacterized protein (TIGR02145 family)
VSAIKALLAGLAAVAVSMGQSATISGTVTDTGGAAIAGALVMLETGGAADTTESDGSFTLTRDGTGIRKQINQSLPQNLSATIANGLLYVKAGEKSAVEITAFDLNGKALLRVPQSTAAGFHSLSLPRRGGGVCLYRVKSGNNELVLKSNSIDGVSSGVALSQGPSSNRLAKQAMSTAAINDVIAVTKTGYLIYRVVVTNSDTSGLAIQMIEGAGTVTDADGNVYQTVKIGNQVWMAENLRVTKYNDGSAVPLDTSTKAWAASTPKYCFYNNTADADSIRTYGALYNWHVVSPANLKKIAPTGWHVPSDAEWDTLQNGLIAGGYNWDETIAGNKIAKSLAAKADWYTFGQGGTIGCDLTRNNSSGFSALPGGFRDYYGAFNYQSGNGYWWSATQNDANAWARSLTYANDSLCRYNYIYFKYCGFSVRLVRD